MLVRIAVALSATEGGTVSDDSQEREGEFGATMMATEIISVLGPLGWISATVVCEPGADGRTQVAQIGFGGGSGDKPKLGDRGAYLQVLADLRDQLAELAPRWGTRWPGRRFTVTRGRDRVALELDDAVPPTTVGFAAAEEQARLFRDDVIAMLAASSVRTRDLRDAWDAAPHRDAPIRPRRDGREIRYGERTVAAIPLARYRDATLEWTIGADAVPAGAPAALRHVLSAPWLVPDESSLPPFLWRVADLVGAVGVERIQAASGDVFYLAPLAFP
jgi:hypothetical protein